MSKRYNVENFNIIKIMNALNNMPDKLENELVFKKCRNNQSYKIKIDTAPLENAHQVLESICSIEKLLVNDIADCQA